MFGRKKRIEDAYRDLNDRIDVLYAQNPYIEKASISIYLAHLQEIVWSPTMHIRHFNNFLALLNGGISELYFRGVKLSLAKNKDQEKHMLLGREIYLEITNQEKVKINP